MKKLLSIVVAFASTFLFAQQTSVNDSISLNEVVVMGGVIDLASDRTTLMAVSTITSADIQKKRGIF